MIAIFWLFRSLKKYSDIEALKHDSAILGEIQKIYEEGEASLTALKADEAAVLAKMEAGDHDGAMELFDAVVKTYGGDVKQG
jgi:hypothetical protein